MANFADDNEIIYNDDDFNDEPYIAEDELAENLEGDSIFEEKETVDNSKWLSYAQRFGYNEEFLSDVETEDELFEKINFFKGEEKLEEVIQNEQILEAVKLLQTGKITDMKDYASYVYSEPDTITEITDDVAAKEYLRNQMKTQGLKEKHIETMLNAMEVNDELLTEANERLSKENESKVSSVEKRKAEYLEKIEKEKLQYRIDFDKRIVSLRDNIDPTWSNDLKTYVNQEVVNTAYELATGNQSSDILKRLGNALNNEKTAPKTIAYLHMMLQENDVTIEPFLKQERSKGVKEVNRSWKTQLEQKKIVSGGNGNGRNADDIDWDNLGN